jgi:serine/threonine-protein kinase
MLGGRYRIVAPVGRGGMGEVYRADDLTLGQPVALKFLPHELSHDRTRLEYFYNEVRLSRQVSHPNVCRVHDIGEMDGQPFLSMEFVDGGDLAGLLRRIGRLPPDKGVEIARQLCAGLQAAHDQGVLHRDLKPANVMLDSHGQVRITDFGLARLADQSLAAADVGAGTPNYMAPEQLAGKEVTVRSDIYALGLVLFEIFTGKRALKPRALAGFVNTQEDPTPPSVSSQVSDIDPLVERVIQRCLEKDPRKRPPSALAVAAALPGGNPVAAALAAGEIPSPAMVAASGEVGGLEPAVGIACLSAVVVLLVLVVILARYTTLVGLVRPDESPDFLNHQAREIVKTLGYDEAPAGSAQGFEVDSAYIDRLKSDHSPRRWDGLATGQPPAIYYWYRQGPRPLVPHTFQVAPAGLSRGTVTPDDPPFSEPGSVSLKLDPKGRLIEFQAVPLRHTDGPEAKPAVGWDLPLFQFAKLDPVKFSKVDATWRPPVYADSDSRTAWDGVYPDSDVPVHVEAAACAGKPVYFRVAGERSGSQPDVAGTAALGGGTVYRTFFALIWWVLHVGIAVLAVRNLRLGRGDRRGGARLAGYVFGVVLLAWLLQASHVLALTENDLTVTGLAKALYASGLIWLYYLGLEPYVRRLWPEVLVSWNRLLAGQFRDPLVGRDVLVGALAGVGVMLIGQINVLVPTWLGWQTPLPMGAVTAWGAPLTTLLGARQCVAEFLSFQRLAVYDSVLYFLLFLLLLRAVLRKPWLAACAFVVVYSAIFTAAAGAVYTTWFFMTLVVSIGLYVMLRFGLLATVSLLLVRHLLTFPLTADLSAWYAGSGVFAVGMIVLLAGYGCYTSLAGRPLFRD